MLDTLTAWLVKMDVDLHAVPLGDAEHHIEMGIGVAFEVGWIEATDNAGAFANGGVEQIGRTRRGENAGLGKRDDLDIDASASRLTRCHHGMEIGKPERGVDIDMAPHRDRAQAVRLRQQGIGTRRDGQCSCEKPLLDGQSFGKSSGRTMWSPAIADEALVEVNMPVDEAGQDQQATQIDDLGLAAKRAEFDEPTRTDRQVPDHAILAQRVTKQPGSSNVLSHLTPP